MADRPTIRERLAQWDQLAVIVLVVILSQIGAMLWLDAHRPAAQVSDSNAASATR